MKAIITVDVPEHQIGQEVSVHFKDTMCVKSVCTPLSFLKYRMKDYVFYNVDWLKERWEMEMKLLGVDFSKHDEEIIKETVESVWGKPPYTELLDKIRAEIEQMNCLDYVKPITVEEVFAIIDKYRKGE